MKPVFDSFTQPTTDRRKFLLGGLFASAAGVAVWRKPRHPPRLSWRQTSSMISFPNRSVTGTMSLRAVLSCRPKISLLHALYSQLLTRVYSDENPPVMLLIAQSGSQTGFLQVHRPETCYTGERVPDFASVPHPIRARDRQVVPGK